MRPIPEEGEPEMPRVGLGYISRQIGVMEPPVYRQCTWYDPGEKDDFFQGDGMWNAGKAMSFLAAGVGFVVMCVVLCTCCVAFELPTFDGLFWTCLLCFVAQCLTFLSWGSELCDEYECTWASGTGMNITAAMLWLWAANMIKSFPEALPPRSRTRRPGKRRPTNADDENMDDEDSPYLASNRGGFQDDNNNEGDEFNEWGGDDDGMNNNGHEQGYYDENGDWHEPDEPQGYYDDDGNWYDYNNTHDENTKGYHDNDGNASYFSNGEDPLQPQPRSYYGDDGSGRGYYNNDHDDPDEYNDDPQPDLLSQGYGYDYGRSSHDMSQEEMEFMSESQRTMKQLD